MYLLHEKKELEFNKLLMVGKVLRVESDTFGNSFTQRILQSLGLTKLSVQSVQGCLIRRKDG